MSKITLKEKIGYALGDAAAGGITWKIMSIAFPLFFTNVFGLSFYDAALLMFVARIIDVGSAHHRRRHGSHYGSYCRPHAEPVGNLSPLGNLWFRAFGDRVRPFALYPRPWAYRKARLCLFHLYFDDDLLHHGQRPLRFALRSDDR